MRTALVEPRMSSYVLHALVRIMYSAQHICKLVSNGMWITEGGNAALVVISANCRAMMACRGDDGPIFTSCANAPTLSPHTFN